MLDSAGVRRVTEEVIADQGLEPIVNSTWTLWAARAGQPKQRHAQRSAVMMIEMSIAERDLLKKILGSYLSELRQAMAATKRDTAPLPAEEN